MTEIGDEDAYLRSPERWYRGTVLTVTLRDDLDTSPDFIKVLCEVVAQDANGMNVVFLFPGSRERRAMKQFLGRAVQRKASLPAGKNAGQSLVEFALMLPLLFLIILSAVNFGGFLYSWITVSNAARAGVQYAAMGAAYASYPTAATLSSVKTLVQNETASLPGASTTNPAVTICQNQNGTAISYPLTSPTSICPVTVTAPPRDPETITGISGASTFSVVTIDVAFTYTPLINVFTTGLLSTVSPPTNVHLRTTMRLLN